MRGSLRGAVAVAEALGDPIPASLRAFPARAGVVVDHDRYHSRVVIPTRARVPRELCMKQPAVYILASARNGTLYVGVTSNLVQRVWQHREGDVPGFSLKYEVKTLVWYELHETMESAILREKTLKKWRRVWKLQLIESTNPDWRDLWMDVTGAGNHA